MRLAANTFALQLGDRSFDLKPSLRAAFVLWERYDGFYNLSRHLAEGSITTAVDLINATIVDQKAWASYALAPDSTVIRDLVAALGDLIEFVFVLTGADEKPRDNESTGEQIPFDEAFTNLFEVATGWLGWTPDDAWDATIAEILAAKRGRVAMLNALFGSKEQPADTSDVTSIKDDLNAIGDLTNHVRQR
ncbi:hypothetical protein [Bradyrhizobium cosmicum]|uniref:hypothetical protein n=1 Tax=Bradyrhizobium cosmicum TaxID=1404864 RepID=UPI0028ED61DB|nr:hypothetical protein [Bradyrhizobium cosmicum]